MTIRSYLEKFAKKTPQIVALKYFAGKKWFERTYAEFLFGVRQTAEAYGTVFSLKPREENVAVILPNGPDWLECYLACSGAGVGVVPLDPKLHSGEVEYILMDSGAVVVTTDSSHISMMQEILPRLPNVRAVVIVDGADSLPEKIGTVPVYGYASLKASVAVPEDGAWYDRNVAAPEDVASVIYTSGTTDKPKGAMLTHANFVADATGALSTFADEGEIITRKDVFLVVLPLFHAFSFCANFIVPLVTGAGMYFVRSLYTIGDDVKFLRPTIVMSVPLLAEKIYDRIETKLKASGRARFLMRIGLKRLVFANVKNGLGGRIRFMIVGGAPCPVHVLNGYKALGIPILEGYGLTECAPVVSIAGPRCARVGTIGVKLPNIEVRLADKNDQGVGELQIRGPITMKGYWHNEAATEEAFDGEWLKTGDLAAIDDAGLITIRGRKKALIVNREGKNIYPEEVENHLATDPLIADCVVVGYTVGGIPGEKVGCVVHPNTDLLAEQNGGRPVEWAKAVQLAKDHIHKRCQELADYKRIRKIAVSEEPLVRTSIQKVRRVAYKGTLDE